MTGRTLAIGDVHGCFRALTTLLNTIQPTEHDTLVFLGDIIDRGPDSKRVVERVLALRSQCEVVFIVGNHEELLRDVIAGRDILNQWLRVGGQATVDSYDGDLANIPPAHVRFLMSGASFFETEQHIFVHASLETGISLVNQSTLYLRWKHLGGSEPPHPSGKRVICGHTAQRDGAPLVFDGWVCIDTYAHGGRWLTCLDVDSNHLYQTSESGEVRESKMAGIMRNEKLDGL